jgi:hypothetical protein
MLLGFEGTKEIIISVISAEPGLSAKEVFYRVRRGSDKPVSYQAVHKLLFQLVSERVLSKNGFEYHLEKAWVKSIGDTARLFESSFTKNKINSFSKICNNDCSMFKFSGILELARFLTTIFFKLPNPKNEPNINLWNFTYSIVGLSEEDYAGLKVAFNKTKTYVFVSEDNLLDRLFGKALLEYGVANIEYGVPGASPLEDVMVVGDYVAHVWYDYGFRKLWYLQNRSPKSADDIDLTHHLRLMRDKKCDIVVVISKNPVLCNILRRTYINNFKDFSNLLNKN